MEFVRRISEMGNNLRVENQLKVRQPLSKLEVVNTNKEISELTGWMQQIIGNELNVKDVVEKIALSTEPTIVSIEDTTLGVKIGLETAISEDLKNEGFIRELVRNIQASRKKQGLKQGELISIELGMNQELQNMINPKLEEIKKAVTAKEVTLKNDLEGDNIEEFGINDDRMKMKIIR